MVTSVALVAGVKLSLRSDFAASRTTTEVICMACLNCTSIVGGELFRGASAAGLVFVDRGMRPGGERNRECEQCKGAENETLHEHSLRLL